MTTQVLPDAAQNGCLPHDDMTEQTLRDGLFVCVTCGTADGIEQPPTIEGRGSSHPLADIARREYPTNIDAGVVDRGVTAVFAEFPGDTWRQASLREVVGTVLAGTLEKGHQ